MTRRRALEVAIVALLVAYAISVGYTLSTIL